MKRDYSVFLISHQPEKYSKIQEGMLPELLYYFDGSNVSTFSELVNKCVEASPTEIVIMLSHKAYPKAHEIAKTVELIKKGFGFVAMRRFAFFGFKKELLRKIGMFDERYLGGGFEDNDFINRLIMANIAFYVTEETTYEPGPSSWNYNKAVVHWVAKWKHHHGLGPDPNIPMFEKTMTEENYDYDLGPSVPAEFLTCREYSFVQGVSATNAILPFLITSLTTSVPIGFVNTK